MGRNFLLSGPLAPGQSASFSSFYPQRGKFPPVSLMGAARSRIQNILRLGIIVVTESDAAFFFSLVYLIDVK